MLSVSRNIFQKKSLNVQLTEAEPLPTLPDVAERLSIDTIHLRGYDY
jgi:hypothetical protein